MHLLCLLSKTRTPEVRNADSISEVILAVAKYPRTELEQEK